MLVLLASGLSCTSSATPREPPTPPTVSQPASASATASGSRPRPSAVVDRMAPAVDFPRSITSILHPEYVDRWLRAGSGTQVRQERERPGAAGLAFAPREAGRAGTCKQSAHPRGGR